MTGEPTLLRWTSGGWAPAEDTRVAVVDSWLVEDGRVRGLDRHLARFAAALDAAGLRPADLPGFLDAVPARLPRSGRWFPRIETDGAELRLRLRPDPPQGGPLAVATAPDPRTRPGAKGPDLGVLAETHARGAEAGADEVALLAPDGTVLEGTRAALLWWEGDALCRVDPAVPVLPSVTVGLLTDLARERGVEVRTARPRLADLDGRETWLVNALHGIRPVRAWVGVSAAPGPAARAAQWQALWHATAR